MPNSVDLNGRPFHFIGIGGIGMSALAYVLAKRKLPVSGSDIRSSHITQRLEAVGAHVFRGQEATNFEFFQNNVYSASNTLEDTEARYNGSHSTSTATKVANLPQVICSTAINTGNSEYQAALDLGCPIFHRSDLLAALIQDYQSIAVAGTHGKTTTSSLIGYILLAAGLDPTIVVGGEVNAWEGNARLGQGRYLVAEADESDGSLVKLSATIGIVTNIELDHPDHYQNLEEVITTFQTFESRCQVLVGCIDCPTVRDRLQPKLTYSLHPETGADYTVDEVEYRATGTTARVWERGQVLGQLNLKLLGQHNLSNALAAVVVGRQLGLDFATIASGAAKFEGARRRFELRGEANGISFIDDYAHHPSEVRATLSSARLQILADSPQFPPVSLPLANGNGATSKSNRRVVAIFQPHRYSRTLAFLSEFAQCFQDADIVVLADIYSAGEPDLGKISGQQLADLVANHHARVFYRPSLPAIKHLLAEILQPGDLAIFLGAGNLNQVIPEAIAFYQSPEPSASKK